FLMFVNQDSTAFLRNALERQFELRAAIASQAVEYIASEAFGMDADQRRICPAERASDQRHRFLHHVVGASFESVDPELSEAGREVGFRDFSQAECGRDLHGGGFRTSKPIIIVDWRTAYADCRSISSHAAREIRRSGVT